MPVIAFVHHKGGVGTTMLTQLLAGELAKRGRKVAAVDLDPQGNLSRRMGYEQHQLADRLTTAEVVQTGAPDTFAQALLPCQWEPDWAEHIYLVPARLELENRVAEAGVPGSWRRLHRAVDRARYQFDDILIDTPPTMGHLFDLAACAADGLVLPTTPTIDGMNGTNRIIAMINDAERRTALGMHAEILGIVLNGQQTGVKDHAMNVTTARNGWGDLLWGMPITLRASVGGAGERAEPPQTIEGPAAPMIRCAAKDVVERYLERIAA